MSYQATVCKIHTRVHPNADRIQIGNCMGFQVIVGLDVKDGDLGCYFPTDGVLSERFARENDLVRRKDENGNVVGGGFFEENRRVRAQPFRGVKSDGFWIPVKAFEFTGLTLKEGDSFTSLNGIEICDKYNTPATLRAIKTRENKTRENKKEKKVERIAFFAKHFDTGQLQQNIHAIPRGAVITWTEKIQGTSGRYARLPKIPKKLNWLQRLFKIKKPLEYGYIVGSRNVNFYFDADNKGKGYYESENFRFDSVKHLELHKGETLYYEIYGWLNENTTIMPAHDGTKLKEVQKKYGKKIIYSYDCEPGTYRIRVYRITMTNEDGIVHELAWQDVKRRCRELGAEHVPELRTMVYEDGVDLLDVAEKLAYGDSVLTTKHPKEGVCVRVEHPDMNTIFKFKSFEFKVLEGILKNAEDYVDPEDIS